MIDSFSGQYRWLSNFWPVDVEFEGLTYPSTENAYQAAKTLGNRTTFTTCSPGEAKRYGRKVELRKDWEDIKLSVMEQLLRKKFLWNKELGEALIATHPHQLVEGNTWGDQFWGVCHGVGDNHLGKLLMKIRTDMLAGRNALGGEATRGDPTEYEG